MKHDKHNYPHYAQFMNVYGKLKQIEPHNYTQLPNAGETL